MICQMCVAVQSNAHQKIAEYNEAVAMLKYGKRTKKTPIEFLVVSRVHYINMSDAGAENVLSSMCLLVRQLAGSGHYSIRCNNGVKSFQTLMHLHWHVTSSDPVHTWPILSNALGERSMNFTPKQEPEKEEAKIEKNPLVITSVISRTILEGVKMSEIQSLMNDLLKNDEDYQLIKARTNPRVFFTESYLCGIQMTKCQKILSERYPQIVSLVNSELFQKGDSVVRASLVEKNIF